MGSRLSALNSQLKAKRGFALLITVTLLAFIVVLLIGLAMFTRIETAVAGNVQKQAQARENALLGLNVALRQLQQYGGPDKRVTATAQNFGGIDGTRYYTGVWSSDLTVSSTPTTPLTWLVSGNEFTAPGGTVRDPLAILPSAPGNRTVDLVGRNSLGTTTRTDYVVAPLADITAAGVPGTASSATTTIGRYAWWVGDQGVKAPVAVADVSNNINYAPYDSTEMLTRLRQQVALGAGAADETGAPVFEPRDANNANLVQDRKVVTPSQIAFLRGSSNSQIGLTRIQQNFHAWSPNNFAVLANSNEGGLRRDLSLRPDLLGPTYAAWANFGDYMEIPSPTAKPGQTATSTVTDDDAPTFPAILPAYTDSPVRRRYVMRGVNSPYRVAPVLSFFGLSFSIRNNSAGSALEVSARCVVGLWNPYTSALVPEDLQIVVKDLPNRVHVHDSVTPTHQHVNLVTVMADQVGGGELKFFLPFTADGVHEDRSSWLPGRIYNWSAESNTADPANGKGKPMAFYERNAVQPGSGIVRDTPEPPLARSTSTAPVDRWSRVTSETQLSIELLRASDGEKLGEFKAPIFAEFATDPSLRNTEDKRVDFAFIFRLPDAMEIPLNETAPWLLASGRDPRQDPFPASGYIGPGFGVLPDGRISPALLSQNSTTGFDASYPDLLLDRDPTSGSSYNEDVPVFELPRSPLLSLGSLQHLAIADARPFATGNSWGGLTANAVFDQFFFSGVGPGTDWKTVLDPLPNPLLQVLRRKTDGREVTIDEINGTDRLADGFSAKHLLQGGAFNINSSNKVAWIAVLRSLRFPAGAEFKVLDADAASGTAADVLVTPVEPYLTQSRTAAFARFAHSAQEVFKAEPDYSQSQFSGSGLGPVIDTPLFRRGIRTLSASDVALLAEKIVELIAIKHTDSGPFRSLAEFLSASPLFVDARGAKASLIEKAIENASLNDDAHSETGRMVFGSQWLTQGDILTALAPFLFTRSDTFVIRTYGETVNPATNSVEGRAWAEAIVQRIPEYFDPSDPSEIDAAIFTTPSDPNDPTSLPTEQHQRNQLYGRRFKVVSFRWLTRSDI